MSTSNGERSSRSIVATTLLVVFLLCTCCLPTFWLPQWINDRQLAQFAENLYRLPLPPKTQIVSRTAEVGLFGNGNHCDFIVTQTMITELTRDQIERYYNDVELPPVNDNNTGKALWARGQPIPVLLKFEDKLPSSSTLQFTATLYDLGYDAGLDIRCH